MLKLQSLRIAYVLGSQFPTPRAYGVTTRETLEVLQQYSINFKIFCLNSAYTDSDFETINSQVVNFRVFSLSKILRHLSNYGNSKLNYLIWRSALFLDISFNYTKIDNYGPNVIWTRDPLIAYIFAKKFNHTQIILEVHESVGEIFYKKLKKFNVVNYFPINEENKFFLSRIFRSNKNYEIMPMGIKRNTLLSDRDVDSYVLGLTSPVGRELTISYIGGFEPGGYSKGVDDLIYLARHFQDNLLPYKVKLIGASPTELKKYLRIKEESNLLDRYLLILPHISHSEALSSMSTSDLLILPAYKSIRYMGMPLKLLEYLNSGKVTLIEDCELYRNFLPTKLHPLLYQSSEPSRIVKFIQDTLQFNDIKSLVRLSVNFSSDFTWERRTLKILDTLLS